MPHLTPQQRVYIRKRTRVDELDPSESMGELNIVPFLDIVVNIIMFLLATTVVVMTIAQIDAQLPELRRGVGSRSPAAGLNLNVTITDSGVIVAGSGGKLAPGCENTAGTGRVITVPKRVLNVEVTENGRTFHRNQMDFDWQALTDCVARVKAVPEFSEERQVIIGADPMVPYEAVVKAMDAVRSRGTTELFPDVLLSAGVR